jgi:formimidoylglutamase
MIEGRRAAGLLRSPAADESVAGRRVVLGLPYDGGIPTRPGARFGPRAIREALSGFTSWDGEREVEEVLDLGDLSLPTMNGREAHAMIQAEARRVFAAGARPIFLGGDHGCTGSIIRGLAAARPEIRLALISIDAHLDVREYADDAHLSSGTPFRRALETPILTGGRTAMIGIRRFANAREHESWAREAGVHILAAEEVEARGAAAVARAALEAAGAGADALYLSVDLDAADAAAAPGVSAPGIAGLTAREMIGLVREITADPRLIGCDVMELSPPNDQDGRTARLGGRVVVEMMRSVEG